MTTLPSNLVELVKLHNWLATIECVALNAEKALTFLGECITRAGNMPYHFVWEITEDPSSTGRHFDFSFKNPATNWKYTGTIFEPALKTLSVPFLHTLCKKIKKEINKGDSFEHFEELSGPVQSVGRFGSLL